MKDIIVFQKSVRQDLFKEIKDEVLSDSFPWFYTGTTLGNNTDKNDKFNYSFFHNAFYYNDGYSHIGQKIEHALVDALTYMQLPITKMLRIRLGLITVTEKTILHTPHIDFPFEHKTGLLYINDSDGDTILYNERYDITLDKTQYDQKVRSKDNEIITTFTPEENKLVLFDGLLYHSSSSPTKTDRRVVINFNYQ
jgi:hypothetical protein